MKVSFTFRHMDSTEDLKGYTLDKLERMERYEDHELQVHVVFEMEKFYKHVELTVSGSGQGHTFVARETREDMVEAIDLVVDKLERQLERDKSKRKHHKGAQGTTPEVT